MQTYKELKLNNVCDIFSPMTNGSSDTDTEVENDEKLVEAELEEVVVEKPVSTNSYPVVGECIDFSSLPGARWISKTKGYQIHALG
jgi:hypothetical protein